MGAALLRLIAMMVNMALVSGPSAFHVPRIIVNLTA
jgi:hypothetical protein